MISVHERKKTVLFLLEDTENDLANFAELPETKAHLKKMIKLHKDELLNLNKLTRILKKNTGKRIYKGFSSYPEGGRLYVFVNDVFVRDFPNFHSFTYSIDKGHYRIDEYCKI